MRNASSVLKALAGRMLATAHLQVSGGELEQVEIGEIGVGDRLVVLPHETCPVDGTVLEGHGVMDESYLTGEPYMMSKTPGVGVLSGAINGEAALTIRADKGAVDSRYARIIEVMRGSQQNRPWIRRLGDALGAWYKPLAQVVARPGLLAASAARHEVSRQIEASGGEPGELMAGERLRLPEAA